MGRLEPFVLLLEEYRSFDKASVLRILHVDLVAEGIIAREVLKSR